MMYGQEFFTVQGKTPDDGQRMMDGQEFFTVQ